LLKIDGEMCVLYYHFDNTYCFFATPYFVRILNIVI